MNEHDLENRLIPLFEKYGKIGSYKFVQKEVTAGSTMISAFICYEDNSSAQQALTQMNEKDAFNTGDLLNVNWFQKKGDREKLLKREYSGAKNYNNLFMKSLKSTVTLDVFKAVFSKFGKIINYDIRKAADPKINSLMAFCNYDNQIAAKQAKESINDSEVQELFVNGRVIIHYWLPKQLL